MGQICCEDCFKTYRPYRWIIALLRVLMYGFSDWWEFEGEWDIEVQFTKHCQDPYVRSLLINKTRTYRKDDSFVEDFTFYYKYLENKRRKFNISATFLCFDCEKYYCTNCVSKHSGHFTFSKDDKYNKRKWRRLSLGMLAKLKAEGDQKRENMKREQTYLCDVVNVRCEHDQQNVHVVLRGLERELERYDDCYSYPFMAKVQDFLINHKVNYLHILNDNKRWIAIDDNNNYIKIFNVNDNKVTRRIKLASSPSDITEIPSTDPSQCLIAVSFPREKQITIMNIHSTPAKVVSSINVQGECEYLACCNNKLITRCWDYLDGERRDSIYVMNISGKIINMIINLHNLPGTRLGYFGTGCMSVHSESETIYVCHLSDPSCVIILSLDGQVLHSVTFTDLEPKLIHVDKDQNVYVMSDQLRIYKLPADLTHREKIIDTDTVKLSGIRAMSFHNDKFYLDSREGLVYIIQCNSSRGPGQREDGDKNHSVQYGEHGVTNHLVQYKRRAEQINPTIQPDSKTSKRRR